MEFTTLLDFHDSIPGLCTLSRQDKEVPVTVICKVFSIYANLANVIRSDNPIGIRLCSPHSRDPPGAFCGVIRVEVYTQDAAGGCSQL